MLLNAWLNGSYCMGKHMKSNQLSLVLLFLSFFCFSCGKESKPIPQDQQNLFTCNYAEANFVADNCLRVIVVMKGAVKNISSFSIELQPNNTSSIPSELEEITYCEDCPFIPQEVATIIPEKISEHKATNETIYSFIYCPKRKAPQYRWRLIIKNIFTNFPYVITTVSAII